MMANPEGFTEALKTNCAERCAEFGEPPCWRLPDLIDPCEHITPCTECLRDKQAPAPVDAKRLLFVAADTCRAAAAHTQALEAERDALREAIEKACYLIDDAAEGKCGLGKPYRVLAQALQEKK